MSAAGESFFAAGGVIGAGLGGVCIGTGADQEALFGEVLDFVELGYRIIAFEPCSEWVAGVCGDKQRGLFGLWLGVEVPPDPGSFVIEAEEDFALQVLQRRPAAFLHGVADGAICGLSEICGDQSCGWREDFEDELVEFLDSGGIPGHQPDPGWIRHGLFQFQEDHDREVVWCCPGPLANLLQGQLQGGDIGGVVEAGGVEDFDAGLTEAAIGIGIRSGILMTCCEEIAGEWFGEESAVRVCEEVEFKLSDLQLLQLFRERFV